MEREALSGEFRTRSPVRHSLQSGIVVALLVLAGCTNAPRPGESASSTARLTHAPFAPDTGSIAVHCETLIDGVSAQPSHDITVIIRDGHIASLAAGSEHPKNIPWLDLAGHTCLPGLIDMHTHLTDQPEDTADLRVYCDARMLEAAKISRRNAAATLQAGFTAVRDVGTYIGWSDRALRDAINRGEVAGPRMQVCRLLPHDSRRWRRSVDSGRAGSATIPARVRMGVSRGPEEFARNAQLRDRWRRGSAQGDRLRRRAGVSAACPALREMTPEEIAAVVEVAHAAGRKVAAHAHGAQSIRDAILAGADTIEHASLIDDAGIELALRLPRRAVDGRLQRRLHRHGRPPDEVARRSSCAIMSRPPRRSARDSHGLTPRASRSCSAPTRPYIRMGSMHASFRSWWSAA